MHITISVNSTAKFDPSESCDLYLKTNALSKTTPKIGKIKQFAAKSSGIMTSLLDGFHHKFGNRKFEWDISQSLLLFYQVQAVCHL